MISDEPRVAIRMLKPGEAHVLARTSDAFDDPIDAAATGRFFASHNHHLAVAIDEGVVVGIVSSVCCEHPDKAHPELWINEVGVAATHQRRGIAKALLACTLKHARELGCAEAWVLTDRANEAAMALYAAAGASAPSDHVMFTFGLDADGACD